MKKPLFTLRVATLVSLCGGLLLLWFFPLFLQKMQTEHASPRAQRQLVTLWLRGEALGAAPWVSKQAAAYQKAHPEARIWIRTAADADMLSLEEDFSTAPDLILFEAGEKMQAAYVSSMQPLCMAGYALVASAQESATPVPKSLFGVTPAPQLQPAATAVPSAQWPQDIAADDKMGAYFLQLLQSPKGARLMPPDALLASFAQGKVQAALLSTRQIRALAVQNMGVQLLQAVPGSDLVLFAALMQGGESAAEGFLQHLLSENAQRALAEYGLFSPQGIRLYGTSTPILQAVEEALTGGWTPDALTWPKEQPAFVHAAQALYKE